MKDRPWILQLILATLLGSLAFAILSSFDAFELLLRFSREHEEWELDEIILAVWIFLIIGMGFAVYNLYAHILKQRQQARQLMEAREKAEELSRLKSDLLSMVSHELRTPLTSINGFAKLIQKYSVEMSGCIECGEDVSKNIERIWKNTRIIIKEGDRLAGLVDNVLDLAKIESGQYEWDFQPIFLQDVLEKGIEATRDMFLEKGLPLEESIEPNLPAIVGDFDRLVQVCVNLLSNAAKFTQEGQVACRMFRKDEDIVIQIQDTGMGVPFEEREEIFNKFKQVGDVLTDKPKGTGLGLSICKEIIRRHNGEIWCDQNQEAGSLFSFSIPIDSTLSNR
ncbi:HAMP domain-containing sensor histidine kinase [Pseudodesulfovibrio sp. zrk46]|uniref:sensor histidine kinase n=1 Tax=Pseudodesulfovibrio sp. zrk46 TaxID=2725288 RepID=UPI00144947FC|nr:HAMP domain-containing sensor histidine kinase [Pseudodesulfovibrio sp. zrk46]QJB56123.1 HAMP domain-containing histidine kinase [Pseudodesulfovibrio sp. zrk46]